VDVYIQMEIKARELEGRTLLALAAAERGHHVLLGDVERYLDAGVLPPGVFHDKDLTPTAKKVRRLTAYRAHGHRITSQDEEHWLALPSFDVPAARRFATTTLDLADASFAWGEHEADALRARYPDHADRIVVTGSPRADLWRRELGAAHTRHVLPVEQGRPVVLFPSNHSAVLDVNQFWVRIRDKRDRFEGLEDPFEFDRYGYTADKMRALGAMVRAVRRIATTHPEALVVVRPHPIEIDGAWEDLLGPLPNVLVTRVASLQAWVRRAAVVVHNECTSGYEAAVAGVPVVSFHADGVFADHPVNAVGRRASDLDEAARLVDLALRGPTTDWLPDEGADVLERRLAALDGPLAADRMVDHWERLSVGSTSPLRPAAIVAARRWVLMRTGARHRAAQAARRLRGDTGWERPELAVAHKRPPTPQAELDGLVTALQHALGRFDGVRARTLSPDLLLLRPAGRGRRGPRP
jgi:surface carbohydrate biosynthesis protein